MLRPSLHDEDYRMEMEMEIEMERWILAFQNPEPTFLHHMSVAYNCQFRLRATISDFGDYRRIMRKRSHKHWSCLMGLTDFETDRPPDLMALEGETGFQSQVHHK